MSEPVTADKRRFGSQQDVEAMFGLTQSWLERDRWSGRSGLPFYKIGSKVLYDLDEVEAWIKARKRMSTSKA